MEDIIETIVLDLTGPQSHRLKMEPGKGNLSIGPKDAGQKPDLVVGPDDAVNWRVFDAMRTGAGDAWPRHIAYEGNDLSLFDWLHSRQTELVTFRPRADLRLDMKQCRLDHLVLEHGDHQLDLILPAALRHLSLAGSPARITFATPPDFTTLRLAIRGLGPAGATHLSGMRQYAQVQHLSVTSPVMGGPGFDCASLVGFAQLRALSLYGAADNLAALADVPLTSLELRFVADLATLPDLSSWSLSRFIAWNVDAVRGKQLQKQLPTAGEGEYFSVSKLRSRQWFVEEYGLPFAGWPAKTEKAAIKAFKSAAKILAKAGDLPAAEAAIADFIAVLNALPGMETGEREDAAEAVGLLAAIRPDLMSARQAEAIFDAARLF